MVSSIPFISWVILLINDDTIYKKQTKELEQQSTYSKHASKKHSSRKILSHFARVTNKSIMVTKITKGHANTKSS